MADDLDPIRQEFIAELEPYVRPMREAEDEARRFAEDNRFAGDEVRALARAVAENSAEIRRLADALVEDNHELGELRDKAVEAGEALGHVSDEAAEAAHEVDRLGTQARETAADLDLMGLSGLSTVQSVGKLLPLMGLLVGVAASVAPALVAAGLGLGAFGIFAIPTIKQVTGALKDTKQQLAALPAPIRDAVQQVKSLETEWKNLSKAFQPVTLHLFAGGLGIIAALLPKLVPLAQQGAVAFQHIETALSRGINSAGFSQFLATMSKQIVPAIDAIGHLAGALLGLLGHALEALAPLAAPLLNMLAGLVRALSGPLTSLLGVFQQMLFAVLKAIQPMLPGLSKFASLLIGDVGSGLEALIPIVSQVIQLLGPALTSILLDLEPILANLLTPNSGFLAALKLIPGLLRLILPLFTGLASILANPMFATIASDIITAVVAFKALAAIMGILRGAFLALTAVMEVNPIILIATAIGLIVIAIIELWQHSAAFRDFWKATWHDILAVVRAVWAAIQPIVKIGMAIISGEIKVGMAVAKAVWTTVWDAMKTTVTMVWNVIKAVVTAAINTVKAVIQFVMDVIHGHWSAAWHDLVNIASIQIHMVASVIRSVASGFITLLFNAGRDIIQGLINGIKSMFSAVMGLVGSIGHAISGAFSAVLHIFSPSQVFHQHGRNTMLGYINGVMSLLPTVKAMMAEVARSLLPSRVPVASLYGVGSASAPAPALAGVGGGSGPAPGGSLIVNVDGKRLFEIQQSELYRYNVRNSGQVTGVLKPM